jgi:hypothetical protein
MTDTRPWHLRLRYVGVLAGAVNYAAHAVLVPRFFDKSVATFAVVAFVLGILLSFSPGGPLKKVTLSLAGGSILANLVFISLDWMKDPTSHNLFPFELAFNFVLVAVPAFVGALLTRPFKPRPSTEPS